MRHVPLRVKIALWSAVIAGAAMAVTLLGIRYFLREELLDVVEQRMTRNVELICRELDARPGGPAERRAVITEDLIPEHLANQPLEIRRGNQLLYGSAILRKRDLSAGPAAFHDVWLGDNRPFRVGAYFHKSLTIHFGFPLRNYYDTMKRVDWAILVALPTVILACLGGGILVARRALRPVQQITEIAERITADDLHRRLPVPKTQDEMQKLTEVLNKTFARLEKSYGQAVHFASDASHQLKTPIAVMRAGIEDLMRDREVKPAHIEELAGLLQQTRRLTSLADGLLLLARADAGRLEIKTLETDLVRSIGACIEDAEVLAGPYGLRIETDLPESLPVVADPARLEQILLNLFENAVKYNRHGGVIRVTAGSDDDGPFVIVANTGDPVPGEKMAGIFNRFSRGETDERRGGHGLGLSIARELARAQGGDLRLLRSDQEITEFELRLRAPAGRPMETAGR